MKKQKNYSNNNNRNDIDLPAVVDMDTLSYTLDDDLDRRHSILHVEKDKAARLGCDLRPWETEICYVQRELKIRSDRRVAHEKYVRSNPDAAFHGNAFHDEVVVDNNDAN
jgi:hypothetical protein